MKSIHPAVKCILLMQTMVPVPLTAGPECTLDDFADHYIQVYAGRGMISDCYHQLIDNLDKARVAQANLVGAMDENHRRAGYKVGLTGREAQQLFAVAHPLVGVLFKETLLADGATVALESGASLLVELDLVASVKSGEINQADSVEDVARNIEAIIPFIELPDVSFRRDGKNAAALLLASNVGARWGVLGRPVKAARAQDLVDDLPLMTFRLSTGPGEIIREGQGKQLLGHPLNSVLYLLNELTVRKESLKPGQLISLGSVGGPVKAERGRRYTATYSGYGEKPLTVSVNVR